MMAKKINFLSTANREKCGSTHFRPDLSTPAAPSLRIQVDSGCASAQDFYGRP
jgi:hypothetical protein